MSTDVECLTTSLLFHTDAVAAGEKLTWAGIAPWERLLNSGLCPVGEANYGSYLLLMDEHGRAFGLDQYGVLTKWGDTPDELLENLCGSGCGMESVDARDRWPEIAPNG